MIIERTMQTVNQILKLWALEKFNIIVIIQITNSIQLSKASIINKNINKRLILMTIFRLLLQIKDPIETLKNLNKRRILMKIFRLLLKIKDLIQTLKFSTILTKQTIITIQLTNHITKRIIT